MIKTCIITADCTQEGDIVFVVDASGSINEENFALMKEFLEEMVIDLDIESGRLQVGAVTFSDTSNLVFQLNRYK